MCEYIIIEGHYCISCLVLPAEEEQLIECFTNMCYDISYWQNNRIYFARKNYDVDRDGKNDCQGFQAG